MEFRTALAGSPWGDGSEAGWLVQRATGGQRELIHPLDVKIVLVLCGPAIHNRL